MTKTKIFIYSLLLAAAISSFFFRSSFENLFLNLITNTNDLKQTQIAILNEVKKEISTPPPLVVEEKEEKPAVAEQQETQALTIEGTISWTNIQRQNNSLPTLTTNQKLNASAQKKVDDMFKNQYFAHQSPSGESVDNLVIQSGYEYKTVGENLALGNFENDRVLVQAWMDSPGHRENILNTSFTEIGVAVGFGNYEGKPTWLAVQHFGKPLPVCSQPDESINSQINANKVQLDQLSLELASKKEELENTNPKSGEDYNQKVNSYNSLVEVYNNLLNETKNFVAGYNNQVNTYNICIAQ